MTSDPPELGPVPTRAPIGVEQVRQLVASQFPRWAGLPIRPVADGGWDSWTFHLGDELSVRLPSAAEYAPAVEKEHRWLPVLARHLPLPVPTVVGRGAPTPDFPHPWSVHRWIDGRTATAARIADPVTFAHDLATFLSALGEIEPAGGPQPGIHNWFRGGTLRTFDASTRRALDELRGRLDVERVRRAWNAAVGAPWDGADRWFHGDVQAGNLLLDDAGRLAAVIDFGTCGVGDPACDLAVAWTLLNADGRRAFRDRLEVDDDTWARGRGWALWKAVATYRSTADDPGSVEEHAEAGGVLDLLLDEDDASTRTEVPQDYEAELRSSPPVACSPSTPAPGGGATGASVSTPWSSRPG